MPKIQFKLPTHFPFSTEMQIYISHVNQGGHLDNAQLLTLVSEARVRFFQWLGYRESNVEGLAIVVGTPLRNTSRGIPWRIHAHRNDSIRSEQIRF